MFYHLWGAFVILSCLFGNLYLSAGILTDGVVAICKNKTLNLTYNPPLPGAGGDPIQTQEIHNKGVWLCQVEGVDINVPYYVSVILSNATCEKATFTKFLVYGNADPGDLGIVPRAFNLTVNFTDPNNVRQLNVPQTFQSTLDVQNTITAVPANSTATFPLGKHGNGTCGAISNEIVEYTVYAYIPTALLGRIISSLGQHNKK